MNDNENYLLRNTDGSKNIPAKDTSKFKMGIPLPTDDELALTQAREASDNQRLRSYVSSRGYFFH